MVDEINRMAQLNCLSNFAASNGLQLFCKAAGLLSFKAARKPLLNPSTRHASTHQYQTLTISQPWLRLNCSLGEGPFWEDDTNSLRFLDVEKQRVHRVDLNIGPSSHTIVKEFDISIG